MEDFKRIIVTDGGKSLVVHNPTSYPLIGCGSQGAVFKLSEDQCVKIYLDEEHAKTEAAALEAGRDLPFIPRIYEHGPCYVVMDYINAPNLKEYLKGCTFLPEFIVKKLLSLLKGLKAAHFTMIDAPLRHIFVLENEVLKVVDHVNSFQKKHPVPLKLLRDLQIILLKDSFLMQVKRLEPETYREWENYFNSKPDFSQIDADPDQDEKIINVDRSIVRPFIGEGSQGTVYRLSEDRCVKVYGKVNHAVQEKEVLLSCQDLSFIPKVFSAHSNYVIMEYLAGPDLNTYLKMQSRLSEDITKRLLGILTAMKKAGFRQIDAPLRHIIITKDGFKLVDYVYSFSRDQDKPLELFVNLKERGLLHSFLEQVKALDPETYKEWTESPITLAPQNK
ncbi:hypothetical protein E4665_07565 [Sporolactobacillus shoreae]|uniref:Serine/threonine protein kinase n=1 Tax=Sporolactobacillus shoreae TaxID=1465501 RepID=A0A4Z0GPV9_9BACL|nr:hypothetical protein [Sporolactobacillus shoreae]TGA98706.1 hypothetical protein E4665_07565 [Sporolactobacillus shoreae]